MTADCVFCRIIAGEAPATIVRSWPDALALRPLNPVTEGHMLVIPKVHVEDFAEHPWTAAMVMHRAAELIREPTRLWDCNIITSIGALATQTVMHLHVHVVPRREGDGLPLPWTPQQEGFVRYERTDEGWETTFHDPIHDPWAELKEVGRG